MGLKEEEDDVKFRFHNFTVDTMAMGVTERQTPFSRPISPKTEISSSFQNIDLDFVGCDLSLKLEHSTNAVPKAEPLDGSFASRPTTSGNPYSSKDEYHMDIDESRVVDLTAEDSTNFGPYYSDYNMTIAENSEMKSSLQATSSPECDFIDIDDLLSTSTTEYYLSHHEKKVVKEALETIDLTGIGEISLDFILSELIKGRRSRTRRFSKDSLE
jgi:hypothetical protein